ncbi:hypothetical protein [Persicitalea jodogahamensis]|uniref:Uncharacterized protein n=1 Tax=Persicitalea jodogahamensis TaxID=402147 RepID=A0A8J3D6Q3_9BACT|nr:hypothetical protein [Persicitalea jodogahamensis]GHB81450.1 hypothetical protein GCM10007390_40410 [Persicitalea jodogahamensis]
MSGRALSKNTIILLALVITLVAGSVTWAWKRFGPTDTVAYTMQAEDFPLAKTIVTGDAACDLSVRHYKQIGRELQFELYASVGGLAPYKVEIAQKNRKYNFPSAPHRPGTWFSMADLALSNGPATIRIESLAQPGCSTVAEFEFDIRKANAALSANSWVRHGSEDIMLDVRPLQANGKLYLKDFANYKDGRNRYYLIDNIVVDGLENGIEIKPGYLYSVTACWIDAPYGEWWNKLRNRTMRQQNIWIAQNSEAPASNATGLTPIPIPGWFGLSREMNVQFDTKFPEFEPIKGKYALQYRLNAEVPPGNYFKRGVTHLPKWEHEQKVPNQKLHWTEPPGFFKDRDEAWFSSLSQKEVEAFADQVYPTGVYAYDFEFWNRNYTPEIKKRLLWFTKRLKKKQPDMAIFDYWGGPAYRNRNFWSDQSDKIDPSFFSRDYSNPSPSHNNLTPDAQGESMANYFSINMVDVYPVSFFSNDADGITPSNYLILSAIHSSRINRLFPYQKNNKTIWFGWNRDMARYDDPAVPWVVHTTAPRGEIIFNQLAMMPASQALGLSLFSFVEAEGYYLWHDNQPLGRGANNYLLSKDDWYGFEWFAADGRTDHARLQGRRDRPQSPRYWDYPTEFYVLGNWMAKQVEDILVGGKKVDLDYQLDGQWRKASVDQAVQSAARREPFVMAVVNQGKIAVLGIDSFQKPNESREVTIRLPNGKTERIQLYGNWPGLYRGTL